MPCYDPPGSYDPKVTIATLCEGRDKYVATLKEIEDVCARPAIDGDGLAREIILIIHRQWNCQESDLPWVLMDNREDLRE
jgi:hypothetical protein